MKRTAFPLADVYRLLEPGPVVLVTTTRKGRANTPHPACPSSRRQTLGLHSEIVVPLFLYTIFSCLEIENVRAFTV
jgi:hypothetical protein